MDGEVGEDPLRLARREEINREVWVEVGREFPEKVDLGVLGIQTGYTNYASNEAALYVFYTQCTTPPCTAPNSTTPNTMGKARRVHGHQQGRPDHARADRGRRIRCSKPIPFYAFAATPGDRSASNPDDGTLWLSIGDGERLAGAADTNYAPARTGQDRPARQDPPHQP